MRRLAIIIVSLVLILASIVFGMLSICGVIIVIYSGFTNNLWYAIGGIVAGVACVFMLKLVRDLNNM